MTDPKGKVDLYGGEAAYVTPHPDEPLAHPAGEGAVAQSFNQLKASSVFGTPSVMLPVGAYHFDSSGHHAPGFNEHRNYGLGVSAPFNSQAPMLKDMSAFLVAYRSSYAERPKTKGDIAVIAGVNWDPLRVDMGPLQARAGLTAGIAYTTHGTYARDNPEASAGKFTLMGALHAEVEHKPSGFAVGANLIPARGERVGMAAFYLKKEF